jgi:uncharacterized circularly permuted ATP-grasp superfamily protein
VLAHLDELVVKAANESGGYGMLIGPHSTQTNSADFRPHDRANPRNYIAQPTINLSRAPILADGQVESRHVDLRPYILYGSRISRRADARGVAARFACRQLVAGRRQQRYVGAQPLSSGPIPRRAVSC